MSAKNKSKFQKEAKKIREEIDRLQLYLIRNPKQGPEYLEVVQGVDRLDSLVNRLTKSTTVQSG